LTSKSPSQVLDDASKWWTTEIIDIHPGEINIRGYPIEQLIGELRFPEMIWLMLRGDLPSRPHLKLFEAALVAAVDHGPHAPSIAISRMAVTCGLPINGAMASAINALDDVHGGAGQQCMALYAEIAKHGNNGTVAMADVDVELDRFIEAHGKIVAGFGHRFHGVDPRAVKLLSLVDAEADAGTVGGIFRHIGRAVDASLSRRKGVRIPMNIDGATAVIYSELGFPPELGRGLFVLSRSVGILAHAWEQRQQGGRIKGPMPTSIPFNYAGPPERPFTSRTE